MFTILVSVVFALLASITPASPRAILYEDGSALFVSCSPAALAQTIVRIIESDVSVVFDTSEDSPLANVWESWRELCAWRVIPPSGPIGLGLALYAGERRVRRLWLANPTPQCGQYNLIAVPTKRDAIAYVRDALQDDDPPRDSSGQFTPYGPVEGVHYWPITEQDVPIEDWRDYVEECASF